MVLSDAGSGGGGGAGGTYKLLHQSSQNTMQELGTGMHLVSCKNGRNT